MGAIICSSWLSGLWPAGTTPQEPPHGTNHPHRHPHSDKTYGLPSAVIRHNLVSCRQGAVWLGKPDRGLPRTLVKVLNEQIEAGYRTLLFIIDPDGSNPVMHVGELQAVNPKSPPDKELIPLFYRQFKLLSRIKAWLKVADLDGFRLDEWEGPEQANTRYDSLERQALELGATSVPGYFELWEARQECRLAHC